MCILCINTVTINQIAHFFMFHLHLNYISFLFTIQYLFKKKLLLPLSKKTPKYSLKRYLKNNRFAIHTHFDRSLTHCTLTTTVDEEASIQNASEELSTRQPVSGTMSIQC